MRVNDVAGSICLSPPWRWSRAPGPDRYHPTPHRRPLSLCPYLTALTFTVATRTLTFQQGLNAMTNEVIWLIVVATFFARAFTKTGTARDPSTSNCLFIVYQCTSVPPPLTTVYYR